MSAKKPAGSGLGARMAAAPATSAVAAGFAAATETASEVETPPTVAAAPPNAAPVALNIRLPKELHKTLRQLAFDDGSSINAILIQAATEWLAKPK